MPLLPTGRFQYQDAKNGYILKVLGANILFGVFDIVVNFSYILQLSVL